MCLRYILKTLLYRILFFATLFKWRIWIIWGKPKKDAHVRSHLMNPGDYMRQHVGWIPAIRAQNRVFREQAGNHSKHNDFITPHSVLCERSCKGAENHMWRSDALSNWSTGEASRGDFLNPLFTPQLLLFSSQHPAKRRHFMLKDPSLQRVPDGRQAHVLVAPRRSFKTQIRSVPVNLTISFITRGKSNLATTGLPVKICTCDEKGGRRTCGWCIAWSSWSHHCHSCDCIYHTDPTNPSNPHWAPGHEVAV